MLAGLGRLIPHPLRQSPKGTDHPSPEKTAFSDTVKGKGGGSAPRPQSRRPPSLVAPVAVERAAAGLKAALWSKCRLCPEAMAVAARQLRKPGGGGGEMGEELPALTSSKARPVPARTPTQQPLCFHLPLHSHPGRTHCHRQVGRACFSRGQREGACSMGHLSTGRLTRDPSMQCSAQPAAGV